APLIRAQKEENIRFTPHLSVNDHTQSNLKHTCSHTLQQFKVPMTWFFFCSLTQCSILQVGANFLERVVWKFDGRARCWLGLSPKKDIELVLFMLKNVGFALRKDDALALKELGSSAKAALQTMLALKNNDMRKVPVHDPEPVERLQKLQRTLRSGASDVKLRVSLENLLAAEQVGRWWIVGLLWSRAPMIGDQDIRRNIFCVIMTSEDYLDSKSRPESNRESVERTENSRAVLQGGMGKNFSLSMCKTDRDIPQATYSCNRSKSHETSLARVLWLSCKTAPLRVDHVKSLVSISAIVLCLVRISGIPKLGMLWEGLKLFISHFLLKNAQPQGPAEQTGLLSEQAEVAPEAKETKLKL
uniref:SEC7 domain-containing protein n=1 Tax=Oncorhynchus tshawytscha TaxID=74940 RepID=A0A8C8MJG1_ONCTS